MFIRNLSYKKLRRLISNKYLYKHGIWCVGLGSNEETKTFFVQVDPAYSPVPSEVSIEISKIAHKHGVKKLIFDYIKEPLIENYI